ncbi:MAG: hypothetical protein QW035_01770 [Candidatus Anstonellales archaeon]
MNWGPKHLLVLVLLTFAVIAQANETTYRGTIVFGYINATDCSENWGGYWGTVDLSPTSNLPIIIGVDACSITYLDLDVRPPPCSVEPTLHIIAVNGSNITAAGPLVYGDISILDSFITGPESGSKTFGGINYTFNLSSSLGGLVTGPAVYLSNETTGTTFVEGYFNDQNGNVVFVVEVLDNETGWNGSITDFQLMLPNNKTTWQYTIYVDRNFYCPPSPPQPPEKDEHRLYILPVPMQCTYPNVPINFSVGVQNVGDYTEYNVYLYASGPSAVSILPQATYLGTIYIGDINWTNLTLSSPTVGNYTIDLNASNSKAKALRDFVFCVLPAEVKPPEPPPNVTNKTCGECEYLFIDTCIPYECCSNDDCYNGVCIDHACYELVLNLTLVDGEIIEGEKGKFLVTDNFNRIVPDAHVFTEKEDGYTDAEGFVWMHFTPIGHFVAEKEGYGPDEEWYYVKIRGFIRMPSEAVACSEVKGKVVDRHGNPIEGVTIYYEGKEIVAEKGEFVTVFGKSGMWVVSGEKQKYLIAPATIKIGADCCMCPVVVGIGLCDWFGVWSALVLLAVVLFVVSKHRMKKTWHRIVYALAPLAVALIGYLFNPRICALSLSLPCVIATLMIFVIIGELLFRVIRKKEKGKEAHKGKKGAEEEPGEEGGD